ncbi:hypothetical protein [Spiroplasma diminutum]|uniref:Uncharacterized protein n=1 Tax=Spiroplasma diminutum CUAS-1 TaxID=1276221 RepID=S5LZQ5_9MOLU|nr:hypothetical protein [Spiroplasma diminutum]AGR42086.1 hypothetical protein SDIMI_v3c03820 [Spiroplasma diminutum CUAS-1]
MKEHCQNKDCSNELNFMDKKRVYVYDELIEDETAIFVCDDCYKKNKDEENNIDWENSI